MRTRDRAMHATLMDARCSRLKKAKRGGIPAGIAFPCDENKTTIQWRKIKGHRCGVHQV